MPSAPPGEHRKSTNSEWLLFSRQRRCLWVPTLIPKAKMFLWWFLFVAVVVVIPGHLVNRIEMAKNMKTEFVLGGIFYGGFAVVE